MASAPSAPGWTSIIEKTRVYVAWRGGVTVSAAVCLMPKQSAVSCPPCPACRDLCVCYPCSGAPGQVRSLQGQPCGGAQVSVPDSCPRCRNPLVSLCRYQCLQCLGYDLCQSCFLHGMISKNHSIKHRMQEHCQQVGDATGRYASVTEEALEASDVPSICLDCIISPLAEHTVAVVRCTRVES